MPEPLPDLVYARSQEFERTVSPQSGITFEQFLHDSGERVAKTTHFVAQHLRTYEDYEVPVATLLQTLQSAKNPLEHPSCLGGGNNGVAFVFEHQGRQLVAKIPRDPENYLASAHGFYAEVAAFEKGNDTPGLQHLVAASRQTGILVTELLPGKRTSELTQEELENLPEAHIRQAIELVHAMGDKGSVIDGKPDNVLYDQEVGFSILDRARNDGWIMPSTRDGNEYVMDLALAVAPERLPATAYDSPESQSSRREIIRNQIRLQRRFLDIVQKHYPDIIPAVTEKHRLSRELHGFVLTPDPITTFKLMVGLEEWAGSDEEINQHLAYLESLGF